MNSKLTLTAPLIVDPEKRLNAIAAALANSTAQLEGDIKSNIQASQPAGKTYRRTPLVRTESRNNSTLKLRKAAGGKLVVGFTFHRASAPGQPPAIDTARLINSIRGIPVAKLRYRINVGVDYGLPLDDPDGLNRPFFTTRVIRFRPIFFENIRKAALGL